MFRDLTRSDAVKALGSEETDRSGILVSLPHYELTSWLPV